MPQPQRRLLVHDRDMTSTLEQHHGEPLALRVLERRVDDEIYARHIVLHTAHDAAARRIRGDPRPPPVAGRTGAGGGVPSPPAPGRDFERPRGAYRGCPGAFFKIYSNELINDSLQLGWSQWLYGRCNCLADRAGRTIAEVIEILPPEDEKERSDWSSC